MSKKEAKPIDVPLGPDAAGLYVEQYAARFQLLHKMRIVGITGRSGCGKSKVAAHYADLGHPVVDGDSLARVVTAPGTDCLADLAVAFGPDIIAQDGTLRRSYLAQLAFASPEKTQLLNSITHPYILQEMLRLAEQASHTGAPLFFIDGAAIVGGIFEEYCDKIILVTCDNRLAISRILLRDGISKQAAMRRREAQTPEATLRASAHYIIENNKGEERLLQQADNVLAMLLRGE